MNIPKDVQDALKNDYKLIPMADITEEARVIAVRWMECGDRDFIREKHKLASDIMNYARRHNVKLLLEHLQVLGTLNTKFLEVTQKYTDEVMMLRAKNIALTQENELLKNKPA
jgi:hypothetical protein